LAALQFTMQLYPVVKSLLAASVSINHCHNCWSNNSW